MEKSNSETLSIFVALFIKTYVISFGF